MGLLVAAVLAGLVAAAVLLGRSGDEPAADAPSTEPSATEPFSEPAPSTFTSAPGPTSGSEVPPPPGPPADEVAEEFLAAVLAQDCEVVDGLSTADFLATEGGCASADLDTLGAYDYELDPQGETEFEATYVGTLTDPDDPAAPSITFVLRLVPDLEGWRVDVLEQQP